MSLLRHQTTIYFNLNLLTSKLLYCICSYVWKHMGVICTVHYTDVTMSPRASQITSLTIVYSTVYSGADQRKNQSSASLAFVQRIYQGPVNSLHKRLVTRKIFPFDDVIMTLKLAFSNTIHNWPLTHLTTKSKLHKKRWETPLKHSCRNTQNT